MGRLDGAIVRLNAALHYAAALWLFGLAIVILVDVAGRGLLNTPLQGTAEIVANSVVCIAFLQLCHAAREGRMLRVELLDALLPAGGMRVVQIAGCLLGALLFAAIAVASWEPMLNAWRIGEYADYEGSPRIPVYPVRTLIVAMAALAIFGALLLAIGAGIPIVISLGAISFAGVAILTGSLDTALSILSSTTYEALRDYIFAVIPLFVLMGEFVARSGAAADLYHTMNRMLRWVPGRLAVATVLGEAARVPPEGDVRARETAGRG